MGPIAIMKYVQIVFSNNFPCIILMQFIPSFTEISWLHNLKNLVVKNCIFFASSLHLCTNIKYLITFHGKFLMVFPGMHLRETDWSLETCFF